MKRTLSILPALLLAAACADGGAVGIPGSLLDLSLPLDVAEDPGPAADAAADLPVGDEGPEDVPADLPTTADLPPADALPDPAPDAPATDDASPADAPAADLPADAPDVPPPPIWPEVRAAWAYPDNPDGNGGQPVQVALTDFTDPAGHLAGRWADVWNCLNEDGGFRTEFDMGNGEIGWIDACHLRQTVLPGEDGTYLHVLPPADGTDPNDPFAEVQMYHGIGVVHRYFRDVLGHAEADRTMFALVNLQYRFKDEDWFPFDNAAYIPAGGLQDTGLDVGVDVDMLAFGQGETLDYSYESDVIHHEYTHSVVGVMRLMSNVVDSLGLDPTPVALNEGLADYFPASMAGDPVLGAWALGDAARDLSVSRRCPDDLVGEPHYDGRIWSSTLWDLRGRLGAEVMDPLAFLSLLKAGPNTTLSEMADLFLETVDEEAPDLRAGVKEVLGAHGVRGCLRVRDWVDVTESAPGLPVFVEGRSSAGLSEFRKQVPAPLQFRVDVPEGATSIEVVVKAAAAGGMFGSGDETVRLRLAAVQGAEPIRYTFFPSQSNTAAVTLDPVESTADTFRFVLAGSCLKPGPLHVQLISRSYGAVVVGQRTLTVSSEPFAGTATWTGCDAPAGGTP